MIIAVASGKGGTGKTTIAVNLAAAAGKSSRVNYLDLDVETPNSHIFLKPKIQWQEDVSKDLPVIDQEKCTLCDACAEICAFNAMAIVGNNVLVFPDMCHSCKFCGVVCAEKAINDQPFKIGEISGGNVDNLWFAQGLLNIGESSAHKIVQTLKNRVMVDAGLTIVDLPPGTGCSVVEGLKGSDFCILVAESTLFGLFDMSMTVEILRKLNIPFGIVINRSLDSGQAIKQYAEKDNIPILQTIAFDRAIAECCSCGNMIYHELPVYQKSFHDILEAVEELIKQ